MTNIINLTPHPIVLDLNGVKTTFPASGSVARVNQTCRDTGAVVAGARVYNSTFGDVDMSSPKLDTIYIVSGMVLAALNGSRQDVIAPKTDATAIRNQQGQIIAVTGWLI
jgi:hypothetical protein